MSELKKWQILCDLVQATILLDRNKWDITDEQLGAWVMQMQSMAYGTCVKKGMPKELHKLNEMKAWLEANKPKENNEQKS